MHVLITGSSGLVGSALIPYLGERGWRVTRLLRRPSDEAGSAFWDPVEGILDPAIFDGVDAVVHLAGAGIADARWSESRKQLIHSSRIGPTQLLSKVLAKLAGKGRGPRILLSASAVGYYGDRGDEELTEDSTPGAGFLANLCQEWEGATQAAQDAGLRVVLLRSGIVLSAKGGALARMLPPFRLGLGGHLGSGNQYISWISIQDSLSVLELALTDPEIAGPLNVVSPNPVQNREFARVLGAVLHRPAVVPIPDIAVRLALGDLADEMLFAGQRVKPLRLTRRGFAFALPDLQPAIEAALA